jgi:hypothetical protein
VSQYFVIKDPRAVLRGERLSGASSTQERLAFLNEASSRVGTSLNLWEICRELADVVVPRFADTVAVFVQDRIVTDNETPAHPADGMILVRRMATAVAVPNPWDWDDAFPVDEVTEYPTWGGVSPHGQCIGTWRSIAFEAMDDGVAREVAGRFGRELINTLLRGRPFLVVPLLARNKLVGIVIFTRNPGSEPFTPQDIALAEELAGRTGICIDNARLYARERRTALTLQSSLLPKDLAKPLGLEITSSYLPASDPAGVGGDWFDVIPLPGFRVALVVGDVMGHGIRAAATMGQLRTAARTLAGLDLSPAEVLVRLNEMVRGLDDSQFTTCVYATYDPVSNGCVLARAGHLPPILLHPGGGTELIDVPGGLPLGIGRDTYEERAVTLPRGSVLVLYTDGLVETRRQDIEVGLDIFRSMLAGARCDLTAIRASVESTRRVGDDRDDMALLAAKVLGLPADRLVRWQLSAGPRTADEAARLVRETLRRWRLDHAAESGEQLVRGLVADSGARERERLEVRLLRGDTLVYEVAAPAVPAPPSLPDQDWDGLPSRRSWPTYRSGTRWTGDGRIHWCEQNIREPATTP